MRAFLSAVLRATLLGLIMASLLNLPLQAASAAPLGMVVTAENARLDNTAAVRGVDLYPGDQLATEVNGSLRLKLGASQVYLLALSAATLAQEQNRVRARLERGALGFSTDAAGKLEVETPAGSLRAAEGQAVYGQVAIISASEVRVNCYEGTLLVKSADGSDRTIAAGESYEATLAPNAGSDNAPIVGAGHGTRLNWNWRKIALYGSSLAALGATAYIIYDELTESCSRPDNC